MHANLYGILLKKYYHKMFFIILQFILSLDMILLGWLASIYIKISKKNSYIFIGKISVLKIISIGAVYFEEISFHFLMGFTAWILGSFLSSNALISEK
jgi:hypothetical protein